MEEFVKTLSAFFGGGLLVALIQWVRVSRSEREKRHSEYIHEQLRILYGPLFFLTKQNQLLLELSDKILKAYDEYFVSDEWSDDPVTRKTLSDKSLSTLELSNEYARLVIKNNVAIANLLQTSFAYIDSDDINVIQEFVVDMIRMDMEVEKKRGKDIPGEVYRFLGNISYSRPEFLTRIENKFLDKQSILKGYHQKDRNKRRVLDKEVIRGRDKGRILSILYSLKELIDDICHNLKISDNWNNNHK